MERERSRSYLARSQRVAHLGSSKYTQQGPEAADAAAEGALSDSEDRAVDASDTEADPAAAAAMPAGAVRLKGLPKGRARVMV